MPRRADRLLRPSSPQVQVTGWVRHAVALNPRELLVRRCAAAAVTYVHQSRYFGVLPSAATVPSRQGSAQLLLLKPVKPQPLD